MRRFGILMLFAGFILLLTAGPGTSQFGGGGMGMRGMDPGQFFDSIANGKSYISRADLTNPWMQGMFDRMADQLGVTNGQITRDQFIQYRSTKRGFGGGSPGGASGPDTSAPQLPMRWIARPRNHFSGMTRMAMAC